MKQKNKQATGKKKTGAQSSNTVEEGRKTGAVPVKLRKLEKQKRICLIETWIF